MFCTKCGNPLEENVKFCTKCGTFVSNDDSASFESAKKSEPIIEDRPITPNNSFAPAGDLGGTPSKSTATVNPALQYRPEPTRETHAEPPRATYAPPKTIIAEADLPEKFTPLRPWTYFWINVLFCVPIVGFIFLLIFTFNDSNINRRNFARSFWCIYVIIAIIFAVLLIISLIAGVSISRLLS